MKLVNSIYIVITMLISFYAKGECDRTPVFKFQEKSRYLFEIPASVFIYKSHEETIWSLMCFAKKNLPLKSCIDVYLSNKEVSDSSKLIGFFNSDSIAQDQNIEGLNHSSQLQALLINLCKRNTNRLYIGDRNPDMRCEDFEISMVIGNLDAYVINFNSATYNVGLTKKSR